MSGQKAGGGELFAAAEAADPGREPLAARLRPRSLDEFAGQEHIVGPGRLLRRAIQADRLSSLILAGPPGTGKTTLARVIAQGTASRFVTLNAVLAGIADIRQAVDEARQHRELYGRKTILFVDEVHRWNKAQQDALLPWVENGTIVLVGATTENPFFEVNKALVSRSRVFQLKSLEASDLQKVALRALADKERGYGRWRVEFEEGALEHLVERSDGDARNLLNALELAVETSAAPWPPAEGADVRVSREAAEESIQKRAVLYDKDGDAHYDAASALIKSLRGSDPDAALYWLARMVYAGEDPRFILRRLLVSAAEDVGLADPEALRLTLAAAEAFDRVGLPEGQFFLSEAVLYLATAPKSNSALAYYDALAAVEAESAEVPDHLKDANRDAKGFGHGEGYLYPHAYRDHWTAQQYLPDSLKGRVFYKPGSLGLEGARRGLVLERREAQVAALAAAEEAAGGEGAGGRGLVWSAEGASRSKRRFRGDAEAGERLRAKRAALFEEAAPLPQDRILVLDAREGFLAWEAVRRAHEGTVAALVNSEAEASLVASYASTLAELERPLVRVRPAAELGRLAREELEAAFGFADFDLALGRDLLARLPDPEAAFRALASLLPGGRIALVESLPREGGRLSALPLGPALAASLGGAGAAARAAELLERFARFEEAFYADLSRAALGPGAEALEARFRSAAAAAGAARVRTARLERSWARRLGPEETAAWFSESSSWGAAAAAAFPAEERGLLEAAALETTRRAPAEWRLAFLYLEASFQSPRAGSGT